jgi:hypothetical protein
MIKTSSSSDNTNTIRERESELISFPKIVDSSVTSSIITLNDEFQNPKQKSTEITLSLSTNNNSQDLDSLRFFCDYPSLVNINYKLKSLCSQIDESIKNQTK